VSILTLVKTQRKDPRISVRVEFSPTDETHAKAVEAICQSAMDRIVLAHREVHRQLAADRAELGRVSEPACAHEHGLRGPWVDAEAAARIGDVGVHDFLIAAGWNGAFKKREVR